MSYFLIYRIIPNKGAGTLTSSQRTVAKNSPFSSHIRLKKSSTCKQPSDGYYLN